MTLLTLKRIASRPDGTFGLPLPPSQRPTLNAADGDVGHSMDCTC